MTDDFATRLIQVIEQGTIDEFIPEVERAIEQRKEHLKEQAIRKVKELWGPDAVVSTGMDHNPMIEKLERRNPAPVSDEQAPAQFVSADPPAEPAPAASAWPEPLTSMGAGDGSAADLGYEKVTDPMGTGWDEEDGMESTGAQIG